VTTEALREYARVNRLPTLARSIDELLARLQEVDAGRP
jgi:hypothetical protein